jgi:AcrR family transcriptional regulator
MCTPSTTSYQRKCTLSTRHHECSKKKAASGAQNVSPWRPAESSPGSRHRLGARGWPQRRRAPGGHAAGRSCSERCLPARSDLLQAVRAAALSSLARAIEAEIARVRRSKLPADSARATLRAVGTGYLKFALEETGLFRTAFSVPDRVEGDVDLAKAGKSGLNPFQLLSAALDRMAETGALPSERRPGAEYLAWSAVHGLAFLIIEGPLSRASQKEIRAVSDRLLQMVEKGL